MSVGAVEDERGRVRHGPCILEADVHIRAGIARVVPATVHLYDGKGCACRVGVEVDREPSQIPLARELIPHNCELVLVSRGGYISDRAIQLAQE